jgi:uncharacterized membrane protein YdbT with pleckstrin-like domain
VTELKPKRSSFLFARVGGAAIGASMLAGAMGVAGLAGELPGLVAAAGVMWLALVGPSVWLANVAWTKERYEIHDGHLVAHSGGLTSDRTLELDLKNVTHVKQYLSWIRYKFFDVGDVIVQSAGSSSAEVVFRSVRDPDELFEQLRGLMRDKGFSLRGEKLLVREQPSTLGTLVECGSIALGLAAFGFWTGASGLGAALASGEDWIVLLTTVGGLVVAAGAGVFLVLHFFDLKRRTYEVFDDVVEYREGFLSRTNAFIPYENIADAGTKQTFLDQFLGLYDVKVSCQGSGSEVSFRRLARGPEVQAAVRSLVDSAQARRELAQREARALEQAQPDTATRSSRPAAELVPADEAWTAELKMNMLRGILGGQILRAIGTQYTVGPASIASRYQLIGQQQLEFAYDKLTGVQVRVSPVDRLLGTMTVRIWSIGSLAPLDLAHVQRSSVDLPALLRQAGIPGGEARATLLAELGPGVWLRARVGTALFVALCTLGALVSLVLGEGAPAIPGLLPLVAWVLAFFVARVRAKHQVLTFHEHHMEHRSGVFWQRHVHARYDDVKKLQVRCYAGTTRGRLTVFVAGETAFQTKKGTSGAVVQNRFTTHYLPDVTPFRTTLDPLLLGRLAPEDVTTVRTETSEGQVFRPAVANTVVLLGVLGVFLPPLWLLLPWRVLSVKRRVYRVKSAQAVLEEGVVYRTYTSVLFDRIDSMTQGQGLLGKVFNNGTVTLMTAGSSRPDLVLANAPGYAALYKAIRERYGG